MTTLSSPPTHLSTASACIDGDDLVSRHEEAHYAHLLSNDKSVTIADINRLRRRRKCTEEVAVCAAMLRSMNGHTTDFVEEKRRVILCHAAALEELGRRGVAVTVLSDFVSEREASASHVDVATILALAKILFKDDRKAEAKIRCESILEYLRVTSPSQWECDREDAADAYHLAGWVHVHDDDHTAAYRIWTEGCALLPECEVLSTQFRKRACWDGEGGRMDLGPPPLGYSRGVSLEGYAVSAGYLDRTPALALFDRTAQRDELVFRTNSPVLGKEECEWVVDRVSEFHKTHRDGRWSTVRHSSVKTTDVAVEDIPVLRPWLNELLHTKLYPLLAAAYPMLADGTTTTTHNGAGPSRMRVHDAFIVRYDATTDGDASYSLPEHSDTSAMSFTVALNEQGMDFEGGGTWFQALGEEQEGVVVDAQCGHAVAFAGPLRHAGYPVTSGCRIILVLFLYIDDFPYGHLLNDYKFNHQAANTARNCDPNCADQTYIANDAPPTKPKPKPSGDMPGGFVVYNQTVELVNMLNRRVASVLE